MIWTQPDAATYSSRDRIAKQLEIEAIAKYVKDGITVLDVGCGDGETMFELAKRFNIKADGLEFSPAMLKQWEHNYRASGLWPGGPTPFGGPCCYVKGDVLDGANYYPYHYDLIYTERCLINLPDWESQKKAIGNIAKALKPGGLYVMCENSWEGLQFTNDLRERVGLPRIEPPDHNRYLWDEEIEHYAHEADMAMAGPFLSWGPNSDGLVLESVDDYSGTYYFLSRIVSAKIYSEAGKEPDYNSQINRLALSLPPIEGLRGQGRIWLWRKA